MLRRAAAATPPPPPPPPGAPSAAPAKRQRREPAEDRRGVRVIRRAGGGTEGGVPGPGTSGDAPGEEESGEGRGGAAVGLSLSWCSDTGRCVDASPVIVARAGAETAVLIGSHSHRVQALALSTGGLLWERVLGDRIEASAAVSHCGSLVVIGQYSQRCVHTPDRLRLRPRGTELFFLDSPQVATTAVCTSCAQHRERHGGHSRRETP